MKEILIVDDSVFLRNRLRQTLAEAGYRVQEAPNGKEAIGRCTNHRFDAILTDLVMPVMDGFQFLEQLHQSGSRVPVMVLTADVQNTSRHRCEELGVRCVHSKPIDPVSLLEAVQRLVTPTT